MRSTDVTQVLGLGGGWTTTIQRLRSRAGVGGSVGTGKVAHYSPGDVLAMHVVRALDGPSDGRESPWAEGARKCGEALDNGYRPAYLVTRGHTENVVVIESENPAQTDEMVSALLMQASDAGAAVKVVRLRQIVALLEPWMSELIDA